MTGIASAAVLPLDMKVAASTVKRENTRVAKLIGINKAARTTCVKPAGTTSLVLGTSSGINVAGAIKLAKDLGPNHTIVTILCDKSDIYRSKLFNKKFLTEKGLPCPKWL